MKRVLFYLASLNDSDVEWLARHGVRTLVPSGKRIIEFGKKAESIYIILDGTFGVTIDPLHKEVARLSVGEIAGEMSFVDSRPPSATVTALTDSYVIAISRADMAEKLAEDDGFSARFYKAIAAALSDRLRTTTFNQFRSNEELNLNEDFEDKDEIGPDMLESLTLAGDRFARLQRRTRGVNA